MNSNRFFGPHQQENETILVQNSSLQIGDDRLIQFSDFFHYKGGGRDEITKIFCANLESSKQIISD